MKKFMLVLVLSISLITNGFTQLVYIGTIDGISYGSVTTNSVKSYGVMKSGDDRVFGDLVLPSFLATKKMSFISNESYNKVLDLYSLVVEENYSYIGENAFDSCVNLKSIVLPSTLQYIYTEAFYNCTSLDTITSYATTAPTLIGDNIFGLSSGVSFKRSKGGRTLIVPSGCEASYNTKGWNQYFNIVTGIDEQSIKQTINIYPNPFENVINIENDDNTLYDVNVYDNLGRLVLSKETNKQLDLTNLKENTLYFVEIYNNDKLVSRNRVVKK